MLATFLLALTVAAPNTTIVELTKKANREILAGRYEKGIRIYDAIYKRSRRPEALHNMALTYELWGDHCKEAIENYEKVLSHEKASPKLLTAAVVRLRAIKPKCNQADKSQKDESEVKSLSLAASPKSEDSLLKVEPSDPNIPKPALEKNSVLAPTIKPTKKRDMLAQKIIGGSLLGLGVTGLAVGVVTSIQRQDAIDKEADAVRGLADGSSTVSDVNRLREDAKLYSRLSLISFISGGTLAAAGGAVLIYTLLADDKVDTKKTNKTNPISFSISPNYAEVSFSF